MASHRPRLRNFLSGNAPGAYQLIVRGPDGRPRVERFDDAAAYRARLTALQESSTDGLTIEEIAGLLDV
jgi:hypothetical protein